MSPRNRFLRGLATELGQPITTLLQSMPASELAFWECVWQREYLGAERADYRAGLIASTLVNWSGKALAEAAEPATPLDYMPFSERPDADSDPEDINRDAVADQVRLAMGTLAGRQRARDAARKQGNMEYLDHGDGI